MVDIILRYLEHRDWSTAVASAIPDRKKVSREGVKETTGEEREKEKEAEREEGEGGAQHEGSREGKKPRRE